MAKLVLGPNTTFSVNGTNLSSWVHNVTVEDTANPVDVTGFGEPYSEFAQGMKTAQITASLFQDYVSGGPDNILAPLYFNNTAGTVKVNADSSGTVIYTMVTKLQGYSPISGGVGDADSIDVTFTNFGTAGLTRGTV